MTSTGEEIDYGHDFGIGMMKAWGFSAVLAIAMVLITGGLFKWQASQSKHVNSDVPMSLVGE